MVALIVSFIQVRTSRASCADTPLNRQRVRAAHDAEVKERIKDRHSACHYHRSDLTPKNRSHWLRGQVDYHGHAIMTRLLPIRSNYDTIFSILCG
jgi:hypothetical protein